MIRIRRSGIRIDLSAVARALKRCFNEEDIRDTDVGITINDQTIGLQRCFLNDEIVERIAAYAGGTVLILNINDVLQPMPETTHIGIDCIKYLKKKAHKMLKREDMNCDF